MRGVISSRCPHKKDNPSAPHAKASEPQFAVALTVVFHRDHGKVEDGLEFCEIDSVFPEVLTALRLVPSSQVIMTRLYMQDDHPSSKS